MFARLSLASFFGLALAGLAISFSCPASADGPKPAPKTGIDFNRQIRPLLSDNCFACHGPDEKQRKANLRLDTKEGAFGKLKRGGHPIVAGKPEESELIDRITSEAPSERMPPPKSTKKLTAEQIELLKRWVAEGARYDEHWAFVAPKRPSLPTLKTKEWARNPIDHFILARLEKEGLKPAPEADRTTLLRRLYLDLTGLPPTPADVDAFLLDKSPAAYEKLVDRLFANPHYGERMALDWLDTARFADTHGYHIDSGRDMTRWREYVIDAFNEDVPFDQFTIEQLAGDLLPGATLRQKIASGFNRNHMINFEGGAIPAEYQNAYIVDRVVTTSTVWLGLTTICSQCHDHKYDPISQREFYQLYAFFNNVPENGLDGAKGNAAPMLPAPTKEQEKALARLDQAIKKLQETLLTPSPDIDKGQQHWEKAAFEKNAVTWSNVDPKSMTSSGKAILTRQPDGSLLVTGPNPATDVYTLTFAAPLKSVTGIRLEALPHESFAGMGPGRSVNGNIVMTNVSVALKDAKGETSVRIKNAAADFSQKDFPISYAIDTNPQTGWAIYPNVGKTTTAFFALEKPISGSEIKITLAFESMFGQHQLGRFRLAVSAAADPLGKSVIPPGIASLLKVPDEKRNEAQKAELRSFYRLQISPDLSAIRGEIAKLQQEKVAIEKAIPTTMVMQDMPAPRDTFLLLRGEYDRKGEKVKAGLPSFLPPLAKDAPVNRLGLAKWLVDPSHPLTARVTVNRYWQMFFGTGLVKTSEDFGSQSEPPSHPELLDWLAVQFMQPTFSPASEKRPKAWSVQELVRLIVTSSTYRQSSRMTKDLHARDPENRLLARGPRFRLQAELIRDQALAISGLLNPEIGGKSVSPYQPAGLWEELASRADSKNWSAQFFEQSHGKDLYRRSMYTFWKRTSPPPQMLTFDAPDRETCTVRRARTNTPLQALILMNDPTYVEAARKLAERLLREAKTTEDRLTLGFRLATARLPNGKEIAILQRVLDQQMARYAKDEAAALKLLGVGESPRDDRLSASELAAWTVVSNVLLNLDEVVTKN